MISKKMQEKGSKILIIMVALLMCMTVLPVNGINTVHASTVESYSVILDTEEKLDDAVVTLTDKEDAENTKTEKTKDSVAVFENFVEEGKTYTVDISSAIGYEEKETELTVAEGEKPEETIEMTALEKVTVKGKAVYSGGNKDDQSARYVDVKLSGYHDSQTKTDRNGSFSFELYKGQDYAINVIQSKDSQYSSASTVLSNVSTEVYDLVDIQLQAKQYDIEIKEHENGQVTRENSGKIEHGGSDTVTAVADDGYWISEFKVDDVLIEDAVKEKEYSYPFKNVTENHSVEVTFERISYTLTFVIGEDGKVTYDKPDGEEAIAAPGTIDVEYDESSDPLTVNVSATPDKGYRVKSVVIDEQPQKDVTGENNSSYEKDLVMNDDHKFEVEFEPNVYELTITSEKSYVSAIEGDFYEINGTEKNEDQINKFEVKHGKVKHGSELSITFGESAGWDINSIKDGDDNELHFERDEDTGEVTLRVKVDYLQDAAETAAENQGIAINDDQIEINVSAEPNTEVAEFKDHVIVTIQNGKNTITFNDGNGSDLESLGDLTSENTAGMVLNEEGSNTIFFKSGTKITFENKYKGFRWPKPLIDIQFVHSAGEIQPAPDNDCGWCGTKSAITLSDSCIITNIQAVNGNDEYNTINPQFDNQWQPIDPDTYDNFYELVFDKEAPEITINNGQDNWQNEEITISGTVKNEEKCEVEKIGCYPITSLKGVYWTTDKDELIQDEEHRATVDAENDKWEWMEDQEQDKTYYFYAVDEAGNVSGFVEKNVRIDKSKPVISSFYFSTEKPIYFRPFGTFANHDIKVEVRADDDASGIDDDASGIVKVELYLSKDGEEETLEGEQVRSGVFVFTLREEDFQDGLEISAKAKDAAGNESEIVKALDANQDFEDNQISSNLVLISSQKPTLNVRFDDPVYSNQKQNWYQNGNINIYLNAYSEYAGIHRISVSINGEEVEKDAEGNAINDPSFAEQIVKESKEITINANEYAKNGRNELTIVVEDNSGNQVTDTKEFFVDQNPAEVTRFSIRHVNDSVIAKVLNFFTFGTFFNDQVVIEVYADDAQEDIDVSGARSITLYGDGEEIETKEVQGNRAEFVLPVEEITGEDVYFDKKISASVTDQVGNVSEQVYPNTENSNMLNSGLMIETIKPVIEVNKEDAASDVNEVTADENEWYGEAVDFNVNITDEQSGLYDTEITLNGQLMPKEERAASDTKQTTFEDVINTSEGEAAEDGSYELVVKAQDNAGNVSEPYSSKIFIDTEAPIISRFDFLPENYVEGDEEETFVESTEYGFYFKEDTEVTITATDDNGPSSGINYITYYTVDEDNGKSREMTEAVDENNSITILIEANFKGQIYAKATDNVGHEIDHFVTPDSAVIEDSDKHAEEEHISFEKADTENRANDGTELYGSDVPVTISVVDTYSGIRSVEWSVTAPYDTENNQNGKVTVNNDMSYTEDSEQGWENVETDTNLVTEMKKTITVRNNSNNVVVKVKMTDRAGNTSEKKIEFSIDKTAPVIEIEYDNNQADSVYDNFYKANRKATITITERNFSADDVKYQITNTERHIPKLSGWQEHQNRENPDETYYTATVSYTADGDYTFDIAYTDLAKHQAGKVNQHRFTIDKTKPVVSVSYDNNNASNGNYYGASRTATITIDEHNFDSSRVNVIGVATDNGSEASFPGISRWENDGNRHVATISYTADAHYSFDIEFIDKAGNSIDDYAAEEFYIDQTAPTVEISGISDHSANNGTVAPVITYSDTNLNRDAVSISLSGVNNGEVNYDGSYEDITNGQRFSYSDFEKKQEVDDIYTLTADLTDMAENSTNQSISFSANRFGSVYDLTDISTITGKFLQEETDIVFEETNVDTLTRDQIKVIKNGIPADLVEGEDYTVDVSGGDGEWSTYRYTIGKELFTEDGRYSISVYSEDAAGNINENINETKKAEISFGIDKTAPVIVPVDFESGQQYAVAEKEVSVEVRDNLVLENVHVFLNDEEVEFALEGETCKFTIPESNEKQNVKITAMDAAGNVQEASVENFLVTTNAFVRWYNNTPLFVGTIAALAAAAGLVAFLIIKKKNKKDDAEAA